VVGHDRSAHSDRSSPARGAPADRSARRPRCGGGATGPRGPGLRCVGRSRGGRRAATPRAGGGTASAPRVIDASGDRHPARRAGQHRQVTIVPGPPTAGCPPWPSSKDRRVTPAAKPHVSDCCLVTCGTSSDASEMTTADRHDETVGTEQLQRDPENTSTPELGNIHESPRCRARRRARRSIRWAGGSRGQRRCGPRSGRRADGARGRRAVSRAWTPGARGGRRSASLEPIRAATVRAVVPAHNASTTTTKRPVLSGTCGRGACA
jgi:hypothetical protein